VIFASLRGYRAAWLTSDVIAGALLAAIAIPEQLATARLAGMPAQTGLYAFVAGAVAFAAFGLNRYLSAGADSTIAPIFAGSIALLAATGSPEYAALVCYVALVAGALLVAVGLARAGWIGDLLSFPVTIGFLAGISVHIVVGQLPQFLGVATPEGTLLQRLAAIVADAPHLNADATAAGLMVVAIILASERINARIPGALLALGAAAVLAAARDFPGHGVAMLARLPAQIPHFGLPVWPSAQLLGRALPIGVIVAIVCMMQTAAVVRAFPSDPDADEDLGRDLAAVGAGSLCAALSGSFAIDASPPRTAVVQTAGGRSQLAGLAAAGVVVALIAFGGGLPAYLPQAALAGVLITIALRIFRVGDIAQVARRGGIEIWFLVASATLVVVLPIETGMILSIGLSLLQGMYVIARPPSARLSRVPGTTIWWPPDPQTPGEQLPGVLVFAVAAPISFTNAQYVIGRLEAEIAATAGPVRLIVLECEGVIYVDYTGAVAVAHAIGRLRAKGIVVCIARLEDPRAQASAARTGLLDALGPEHVYRSVQEAIVAAQT
jgi:MFS superfamily sulfate permease-like transporter